MPFDPSTDYAHYPTLAPLSDGTLSGNAYITCPTCGGTAFRLRRVDRMPVCVDCDSILEWEETAQDATKLHRILDSIVHQMESEPKQPMDSTPSFSPESTVDPKLVSRFQIVRGKDHTVILRPDGTVKAVGDNSFGQCNVQDWKNITAVATNQLFTIGLSANGTVKVTNCNFFMRNKINNWTNITSIAAGGNLAVARCSNGTVTSVGVKLPAWSGITAICVGVSHVVALCEDGSVRAVGNNSHGICKVQDWSRIKAIAAGSQHTVGLCEDGTVKAVGYNKKNKHETTSRCEVEKWTRIKAIAAGSQHTVGLHEDGWVFAVGSNENGQCNVTEWNNVVAICAGSTFTAGLRADGTVLCTDPTVHKLLEEIYT